MFAMMHKGQRQRTDRTSAHDKPRHGWSLIALGVALLASANKSYAETTDRVDMAAVREAIQPAPDLIAQGNVTGAVAAFDRILASRMARDPNNWVLKLDLTTEFGVELCNHDKLEPAFIYLRQAVQLAAQTFGPVHQETALAYTDLGDCLAKSPAQAKGPERLNAYRVAYDIRRRTLGDENPETLAAARNLSEFSLGEDNLDQSEDGRRETLRLLDKAVAGFEKLGPTSARDLAQTLEVRLRVLVTLGRLSDAENDYELLLGMKNEIGLSELVGMDAVCGQLTEAYRKRGARQDETRMKAKCEVIDREIGSLVRGLAGLADKGG